MPADTDSILKDYGRNPARPIGPVDRVGRPTRAAAGAQAASSNVDRDIRERQHQLEAIAHTKLFKCGTEVGLDGALGNVEAARRFLVGGTARNLKRHGPLAGGQQFEALRRFSGRLAEQALAGRAHHPAHQLGAEPQAAVRHGNGHLLQHAGTGMAMAVAPRTERDGMHGVFLHGLGRQHDHGHAGQGRNGRGQGGSLQRHNSPPQHLRALGADLGAHFGVGKRRQPARVGSCLRRNE